MHGRLLGPTDSSTRAQQRLCVGDQMPILLLPIVLLFLATATAYCYCLLLLILLLLLSLLSPLLLLLLLRAAACVSARVEGAPEPGQESGHSRFHKARSPASITTSLAGLGPALQQMRRHDARTLPYLSAAGG